MKIACGGFSFFMGGEYLTYAVRCAKIFRKYCLELERAKMERIKTLETRNLCESAENGGCGECQTSCQSACKTSCGVANQKCENADE